MAKLNQNDELQALRNAFIHTGMIGSCEDSVIAVKNKYRIKNLDPMTFSEANEYLRGYIHGSEGRHKDDEELEPYEAAIEALMKCGEFDIQLVVEEVKRRKKLENTDIIKIIERTLGKDVVLESLSELYDAIVFIPKGKIQKQEVEDAIRSISGMTSNELKNNLITEIPFYGY